jgi:hypothetical protein
VLALGRIRVVRFAEDPQPNVHLRQLDGEAPLLDGLEERDEARQAHPRVHHVRLDTDAVEGHPAPEKLVDELEEACLSAVSVPREPLVQEELGFGVGLAGHPKRLGHEAPAQGPVEDALIQTAAEHGHGLVHHVPGAHPAPEVPHHGLDVLAHQASEEGLRVRGLGEAGLEGGRMTPARKPPPDQRVTPNARAALEGEIHHGVGGGEVVLARLLIAE